MCLPFTGPRSPGCGPSLFYGLAIVRRKRWPAFDAALAHARSLPGAVHVFSARPRGFIARPIGLRRLTPIAGDRKSSRPNRARAFSSLSQHPWRRGKLTKRHSATALSIVTWCSNCRCARFDIRDCAATCTAHRAIPLASSCARQSPLIRPYRRLTPPSPPGSQLSPCRPISRQSFDDRLPLGPLLRFELYRRRRARSRDEAHQ
jgi:hypothetical protein